MERKEDLLTAHSLLKFELSFFVVPWKIPIFIAKQKLPHKKNNFDFFFLLLLSQTVIIFQLISFNYSSRSMAYLFPLKTQINIKIERIIVLIKPTSDNTLLIFFWFLSFDLGFWKIGNWTLKLFKSARIIGMGDKKPLKNPLKTKIRFFWQLFGERVEIDFFSKFVSVLF